MRVSVSGEPPEPRARGELEALDVTEVRATTARSAGGDPLVGTRLAGRYRVIRRIGQGGMGAVYLAEHVHLRARVALKVLHPHLAGDSELLQRFVREARAAAASGSTHVVRVWDLDRLDDGRYFLAMEYLEGIDLAGWVAAHGPLSIEHAVSTGLQVCAALRVMHPLGIVHRDLKPENVFLTAHASEPCSVKVLDFGVCKMAHDRPITGAGMTLGTPKFMAPEQLESGAEVDVRADLYALGAVLFFALIGRAPFEGGSLSRLLYRVCCEPAPKLRSLRSDVPAALEALVERALAKRPEERFADSAALEAALAQASARI